MERKEFLQLCQKCAVLPDIRFGVKDIPNYLTVFYDGTRYYPLELRIGFDKSGNTQNKAVLHDMYANSVISCDLEKVVCSEQNRNI
jgi:hypothetical protein